MKRLSIETNPPLLLWCLRCGSSGSWGGDTDVEKEAHVLRVGAGGWALGGTRAAMAGTRIVENLQRPLTLLVHSPGAVEPLGEVPKASHCFHQPAAVGTGTPVQAQQVPVQTQAF